MLENDAWFVWAAQMINFLILVALLRKFLYRPVLEAIASRQQEITTRAAEAVQIRQEADVLIATCRERERELATTRDKMHSDARQEVEAWKRDALDQARTEVDAAQALWWDAIQRERDQLLRELRERAGRQVHQVARHVLTELANVKLEQQLVAVFLDRLSFLDQSTRDRMLAGQSEISQTTVTSALPLSEELQAKIRNSLNHIFGELDPIQFDVDATLLCGLELQIGDQRMAWNAADALETLEHNFAVALDHKHEGILTGNISA